ncbi:CRTAC1 family protein [Haliangium sp.]|uniref:CRTAC1 family protein n=1 Tax=Haliangium sp. TaxID=2663208 RepID=UPI003D13B518
MHIVDGSVVRALAVTALAGILYGCGDDGAGLPRPGFQPRYDGEPLWASPDLAGAPDLGHTPALLPAAQRVPGGAPAFEDVTDAAGLGDAIGGGNQHGVGVAFVDLDGDGWADLFLANGVGNRTGTRFPSLLYRNLGDGRFEDVSAASGVAAILDGRDLYSVAAADYDSDGDVDLYLGAQPRDILLRNLGDGSFEDATEAAGAGGPASNPALVADGRSKVVSFGDFDGDGHVDVVSSSSTLPAPGAYLLRNLGDGRFEDISAAVGVKRGDRGNPCAVLWSDYDNDGDADLWIWNDRGNHVLLRNEAGVVFTDVTRRVDGVTIDHPMGIDGADIDHDGDVDYYVSNIGNNPLMRNRGDGTFEDITGSAGTGGSYGWGLGFEDFDADTWVDLFVAQEDNLPYLAFANLGATPPRFAERTVAHQPVLSRGDAHNVAVAFADYDHDGRTDVVTATTDGSRVHLFRNVTELGSRRWLEVQVARAPGSMQVGGVGARVAVKTGELVQFRDITGGASRASQNELSARFGLGDWSGAEWVVVLWPDGRQLVVTGVEGAQRLRLAPTE